MRLPSPSSFGHLRSPLSVFDLICAAVAPLLALYLTDALILSREGLHIVLLYWGISFTFCTIAFLVFRVSEGMSLYFSVHDALNIVKAIIAAQAFTEIALFLLIRLDGIPRLSALVHVAALGLGLFATRATVLLSDRDRAVVAPSNSQAIDHVIVIGATKLVSHYIHFIRAYAADTCRVVAVLDFDPKMIGRAIAGIPIVAHPQDLEAVVDDYAVHGIRANRVIVGSDHDALPEELLDAVSRICEDRGLQLDFVSQLLGLSSLHQSPIQLDSIGVSAIHLPSYFRVKRWIDFFGALIAIVALSPLLLITALLVLLDVGAPVMFWQQRIGRNGASFLLYKFRTLRSPIDRRGNRLPESRRLSRIGKLLRLTRLDELPQLLNVLVGDMSLIGPRPLLPEDQPTNTSLRLTVRPGMTGWAQVSGGNLVTAEEKGALDDWYIRNASLWTDLWIIALTLRFVVTREKRSESAVAQARAARNSYVLEQRIRDRRSRNDSTDSTQIRICCLPDTRPGERRFASGQFVVQRIVWRYRWLACLREAWSSGDPFAQSPDESQIRRYHWRRRLNDEDSR